MLLLERRGLPRLLHVKRRVGEVTDRGLHARDTLVRIRPARPWWVHSLGTTGERDLRAIGHFCSGLEQWQ